MPRKLIVFIVSIILLATCGAGLSLMSLAGWLFFPPAESSRLIRIAPVAPLEAPVAAVATPVIAAAPPGLEPAALRQLPATSTPVILKPSAVPGPTVTPGLTSAPAGVATRLVIPKLNLDVSILFAPIENGTWDVNHLGQAVGHLEATAPPGSAGNIVLAGHVTLDTGAYGPFANLSQLAPGDLVIVYEGSQEFFYVIEDAHTVTRDDVYVTYPTNTGQLTLLTCIDWNSEEGRYVNRLVVRGRLIQS